ncbi:hypothetical protein BSKO_04880 [Bryopsis sp. KO-2023]|nr:hypothetical protein BSKO_04880 [Bryopsis sp. KO-2023]
MATAVEPPSLFNPKRKKKPRERVVARKDVYWSHGSLISAAESTQESLDRMLAVARVILTFLTDILKPSDDAEDAPLHFLGAHYLTHREIEAEANGATRRALVHEICSLDAEETPLKRAFPGNLCGVFRADIRPVACAQGKTLSRKSFVKVELQGKGKVSFSRHMEEYEFNFPDVVFEDPLSEACRVFLKGDVVFKCASTGLSCVLNFFRDGGLKGSIERLAGNGWESVCKMSGQWTGNIDAHGLEQDSKAALFEAGEKPGVQESVDLSQLGPMRLPRLWTAIHDALVYCHPKNATNRAGERLAQTLSALKVLTPDSMGEVGALETGDSDEEEGEEENSGEVDNRDLPPSVKAEHRKGHCMGYALELKLMELDFDDVEDSKTKIPTTASLNLVEKRRQLEEEITAADNGSERRDVPIQDGGESQKATDME